MIHRGVLFFILLSLQALVALTVYAQPGDGVFTEATDLNPELQRQSEKYGRQYENLLQHAMEEYYFPTSFLLDVRVILQDMLVPVKEQYVPPKYDDDVTSLPGLPTLPEEMRSQADTLHGEPMVRVVNYRSDVGIHSVDVSVLVDSLYTADDFRFIMELVKMTAKLQETRGDRVKVRKAAFPDIHLATRGHRIKSIDTTRTDSAALSIQPASLWERIWADSASLIIPLLLILLFFMIMLAMVLRHLQSTRKHDEERERSMETMLFEIRKLQEASGNKPKAQPEAQEQAQFKAMRVTVLESFIGYPRESCTVINSWMDSLGEKGLKRSSILVSAADKRILESLRSGISAENMRKLHMHVTSVLPQEEVDPQEQMEIFREFRKDLLNTLSKRESEGREGDIFNFLNTLSIRQIKHIIKEEPPGIQGIVLAQLTPEVAGTILQKMDSAQRSEALVSMGQIHNVSIQTYKEVAARLASKALEVNNMRFVAADGIESIIDVIAGMPVELQKENMNHIAEKDLELGERVGRFYVPFEDLSKLPSHVLTELLEDLDIDVLALAITGASAEYSETILQVFPERMQKRIQSGMQSNEEAAAVSIDAARRKLLAHVRTELAAMGGLR
jgi:flagellar motor switch protein FliG/transposase